MEGYYIYKEYREMRLTIILFISLFILNACSKNNPYAGNPEAKKVLSFIKITVRNTMAQKEVAVLPESYRQKLEIWLY